MKPGATAMQTHESAILNVRYKMRGSCGGCHISDGNVLLFGASADSMLISFCQCLLERGACVVRNHSVLQTSISCQILKHGIQVITELCMRLHRAWQAEPHR